MIIEECAIEVGGDRGRNREGRWRWRKVVFVDVKDSDRVGRWADGCPRFGGRWGVAVVVADPCVFFFHTTNVVAVVVAVPEVGEGGECFEGGFLRMGKWYHHCFVEEYVT